MDQLAEASGQSTANASQHLQALHAGGMVIRKREGTSVRYAIAGEDTLRLWFALQDTSTVRLAEVERAAREYLGEDVETIGRRELLEHLKRGDAVLVDVRPSEEYAAGHIDGPRSIPLDELERRLAGPPADGEVVVYCRGPFCAVAHEAVRTLKRSGRPARRLEQGWPEWKLGTRCHNVSPRQESQRSVTFAAPRDRQPLPRRPGSSRLDGDLSPIRPEGSPRTGAHVTARPTP